MHTSPGVSVSAAASCCPHHVIRLSANADEPPIAVREAYQRVIDDLRGESYSSPIVRQLERRLAQLSGAVSE